MDGYKGDNVHGIFGHDRLILGKIGAGTSPAERKFFFVWQLRNCWFLPYLAMKRNSVSCRWILIDIVENFNFRDHLRWTSHIASQSNRHLTQSTLQVTGWTVERYCLLHVVVQGPGSFQGQVNFSLPCRVVELRGVKVPNFQILAYFPHTKPLKRTFRWPAYSPGVTSQNDYDFSMW